MDETADKIEAEIDDTRERLTENLQELESKFDEVTDWQAHFRRRPHVFLGAAFIGGLALAHALRPSANGGREPSLGAVPRAPEPNSLRTQASDFWSNIQGALIGLASARVVDYLGELVPDFDQHYRRAEQQASAAHSAKSPMGRAAG